MYGEVSTEMSEWLGVGGGAADTHNGNETSGTRPTILHRVSDSRLRLRQPVWSETVATIVC